MSGRIVDSSRTLAGSCRWPPTSPHAAGSAYRRRGGSCRARVCRPSATWPRTEHVSPAVAGEAYALLAARGAARLARRPGHVRPRGRARAMKKGRARRPYPDRAAGRRLRSLSAPAGAPGRRRAARCREPLGRPADRRPPEVTAAVGAELEAVVREEGASPLPVRPGARGPRPARARGRAPGGGAATNVDPERNPGHDLGPAGHRPGGAGAGRARRRGALRDPDLRRRHRLPGRGARPHRPGADGRPGPARRASWRRRWRRERPPLLFVNPTGNNATGTILPAERRRALAALGRDGAGGDRGRHRRGARARGPCRRPSPPATPRRRSCSSRATRRRSCPACASASSSAPPSLERRVLAAKMVADRYTAPPLARALASLPRAARRRRLNLDRVRGRATASAATRFLRALERRLGGRATWLEPAAGFNLWLRLPERRRRRRRSSPRAAGSAASSSRPAACTSRPASATSHLRLSFSTATPARGRRGAAAARASAARRDRRPAAAAAAPRGRRPHGVGR